MGSTRTPGWARANSARGPGRQLACAAGLEPDAQDAGLPAPVPFGHGGDAVGLPDGAARLGDHVAAGRGGGHAARVPVEQPDAELGFEPAQRVGECGLADVEGLGGPAQVARVGDRGEIAQLAQLHTAIINALYRPEGSLSWTAGPVNCDNYRHDEQL
ncbi:hypothetical protein BJY14_006860 [Actinomadura luteofluorescens]|uniref:Uncharacterized protein n=1 Tax=Actinomadura luteofluorescens TaxID=46163 RepID=A0A7Y9EN77_9ACTN|nr:hypothetical protein [Actinomadura luteofluorescens]NYD50877.1 hypothetical protein [Actinomadura luteofluorescens]